MAGEQDNDDIERSEEPGDRDEDEGAGQGDEASGGQGEPGRKAQRAQPEEQAEDETREDIDRAFE